MKNKKAFWISVIILAFVALLMLLFFILTQRWLNNKLPEILNNNPERKYELSFEKAGVRIFKKQLLLEDIRIIERQDSLQPNVIEIKSFKIENPSLKELKQSNSIQTSRVIISHATIEMFVGEDQPKNQKEKVNEIWRDVFTRLVIKNLVLIDARIVLKNEKTEQVDFELLNLNVQIDDFNVDTTTMRNPLPIKFGAIKASADSFKVIIDTIGEMKVKACQLSSEHIKLEQLKFDPFLSKEEFVQVTRPKDNWLAFQIQKVQLQGFDWSFSPKGVPLVSASSIDVDQLDLEALVDRQIPLLNQNVKPLLAEVLHSLPVDFKLDSFRVSNSSIRAETRPPLKNTTGIAVFDQLYTSGYNLHNRAEVNRNTEFDILCRFMEEAQVEAKMVFNVNDENNRFRFTGSMRNLSTLSLNKILEPLAGIETAGEIYGVDFDIVANKQKAIGTVDFEYDELKIKVLSSETKEKSWLLSLVSNVALRQRNVKSDRNFRQGKVDYSRDKQKAIAGYVWDAIKDGLMDVLVPIDIDKQREKWSSRKRFRNK